MGFFAYFGYMHEVPKNIVLLIFFSNASFNKLFCISIFSKKKIFLIGLIC